MPFYDLTREAVVASNTPRELEAKTLHQTVGLLKAQYSFATDGGAVGDIALNDDLGKPAILPDKCIIVRAYIDFYTAFTSSGSATAAINANSAGDILAALGKASCTGKVDGIPVSTAATMVKLTAARQITLTVAVAALTAGKANIFVEFVYSN